MGSLRERASSRLRLAPLVVAAGVVMVASSPGGPQSSAAESGGEPLMFDAVIEPFDDVTVETVRFTTYARSGRKLEPTRWRVVSGTGNARENYLASTSDGTLFDFGGEWLRFSEDDGITWSSVLPDATYRDWYSYEGAVAAAPGGDVVAVGQDAPHAGVLRSLTFKYDAADAKWLYGLVQSHFPLVDRPTVGTIPGPFSIAGMTVPYISVMRSGLFAKTPFVYSFDGLNYLAHSSRLIDQASNIPRVDALKVDRWDELDWIQPHELLGLTPYGKGKAIAEKPWWGTVAIDDHAPRTVFDASTLRWAKYDFPSQEGPPQDDVTAENGLVAHGRTLADSDGNLHHVSLSEKGFDYLFSRDGGVTWSRQTVELPEGHRVDPPFEIQKSFKVSGEFDMAAVSIHTVASEEPFVTRDLVYRFSTAGRAPRLERIYSLGRGGYSCLPGGVSLGGEAQGVCDFPSITLLPGGRIAASFTDVAHKKPAIAIQLDGYRKRG